MSERRPFASALEPEYLIMGLLYQQADHGYGIQGRIESTFNWIWRISQSQTYNILKRLEAQGFIHAEQLAGIHAPPRRLFRMSGTGQQRFYEWLSTPTPSSARAIRIEFLTKLYFAADIDPDLAQRLIQKQRAALEKGLYRLRVTSAGLATENPLSALSLDLRIRQLETALKWLDSSIDIIKTSSSLHRGGKQ